MSPMPVCFFHVVVWRELGARQRQSDKLKMEMIAACIVYFMSLRFGLL